MAQTMPNGTTRLRAVDETTGEIPERYGTPADDLEALLVQSLRIAIGALAAGAAFGAEIVRRTLGEPPRGDDELEEPPLGALVAGATLGMAVETATLATSAAVRTVRTLAPWGAWLFGATGAERAAHRTMTRLDSRWREVSPEAQEAAGLRARARAGDRRRAAEHHRPDRPRRGARGRPAIVAGVDLDAVAARLDVDAVARRLDLDAVIDRLDPRRSRAQGDRRARPARADRESTEGVTGEVVDTTCGTGRRRPFGRAGRGPDPPETTGRCRAAGRRPGAVP
jgi:hypothetical protein